MSLLGFGVENYRPFRDRQEIQLAPVTVVLGKNNTGKSALVRAPLLLASGLDAQTSAPFDFDAYGVDFGDAFTDLIFEQNRHGSIGVSLDLGPDMMLINATIQYIDETKDAFVSSARFTGMDTVLGLRWVDSPARPYKYLVERGDGTRRRRPVEFRGLIPQLRALGPIPTVGPIRYLSANRQRPARWERLPVGAPPGLGVNGEGLAAILVNDKVRSGGALIESINGYLAGVMPGWRFDIASTGPLYSIVLTRPSSSGTGTVSVNLVDAGAGLAQVLPIVVQCALDERVGAGVERALQIIEEPETHLHPAPHAELADLYLRAAKATGTRFLIETHSETLLLRLRRRIAEGKYPPEMVAIYVVEQVGGVSSVHRVELDAFGNLVSGWPDGYFTQDYDEVRALTMAQRERRRDAAAD